MIVYQTGPIDWWEPWRLLYPTLAKMAKGENADTVIEILKDLGLAFELARKMDWEGDIRTGSGGPYITALPNTDGGIQYVLAWKQDNNGTTFIASPVELPWIAAGRRPYG
jgi:hypothetical protein